MSDETINAVDAALEDIRAQDDCREFRYTPMGDNPQELLACWGVESASIGLRVRTVPLYYTTARGDLAAQQIRQRVEGTDVPIPMSLQYQER